MVPDAGPTDLPLTGFISPWAAIDTAMPPTKVWVRGSVDWFTAQQGVTMPAGDRPLTLSAEYRGAAGNGCGRVVFTSYEVNSRGLTNPMTDPLTPQERVLEWLLFELGGCIDSPG